MQQPAGGTGYIFMFTMPLHPSRGGPSTRAAQAMALVAAHVTREQVFTFFGPSIHRSINNTGSEQVSTNGDRVRAARPWRVAQAQGRLHGRRLRQCAPARRWLRPAGSLRSPALRSASALRPPRSGSGAPRRPAAQPRPLRCALRGGAAGGSFLCSSLPQPVSRVPDCRAPAC